MRDVSPNANSRVNFSAIFICGISIRRVILFSDTARELCDVWHDAATEAQGGSQFSFVGAADIAVAKWSSATVSARIYRVLSAMDDAAARYSAVQR